MTGIRDYSPTAGSNTAVGGIAITEGMARAAVNNALRAGYADLANLLLDLGGAKATTGSANAYLLALDSAPTAYANNMLFLATFNHAVVGASTINVNSIALKDIKKIVAGSAVALVSGDGPANHIGIFTYSSANNAVILLNPALLGGSYVPGGTDVAIADGGTGQSTAILGFNALSPMTSQGDLIRGGVTGAERVALGASGQLLTSDGTDAVWAALSEIVTSMFAANVVDTDPTLGANSHTRLATQAAVKAYIDALAAGISPAAGGPVACATTANITLSGEQTLDGVLTSVSRVLVKNQTDQTLNGPYLSGPAGWTRTTDADTGAEFIRLGVFVAGGTTQAGATYLCTRTTAPTLGVDNLVFNQNGASQVYTAGIGLGLSGNQFNVTDAELLTWSGVAPGAGVATFLATPTSANLAAALTNETGTGAAVFAESPALVTPAIGAATGASVVLTGGATVGATGVVTWTGRSKISSPADGDVLLTSQAGSVFGALKLGGTTASFPAIVRNGPGLRAELADGSTTGTFLEVLDETYASGWNGRLEVPTKNALYDKIETLAPLASPTFIGTATIPTANVGAITNNTGLAAGVYTPTSSALVNLDSVSGSGRYLRVGNIVSVGLRLTVNATAGGAASFELSLPVASDFGAIADASGVAVIATSDSPGVVGGSVANNTMTVTYVAVSTSAVVMTLQAIYTVT